MKLIWAIALNSFREAIRDRILYLLLVFGLLMIVSSVVLSLLTVGSQEKIITDIGLASISIFGVLISVFIGIGLVSREIQRRTIYTVVTKPVYRYQFLLGKYLGLLLTVGCNVALMTLIFLAVLLWKTGTVDVGLLPAVLMIFVELVLVSGFALLFSSFSTPILSSVFTLALYVTGHLTGGLLLLKEHVKNDWSRQLCDVLYYLLPNLELFNLKHQAVHNLPLREGQILLALLYGLLYASAVFVLTVAIFRRRDFL
jgi:ABC-type transport system involved in multi-copper enzyme maturation permease subunit